MGTDKDEVKNMPKPQDFKNHNVALAIDGGPNPTGQ